MSVPARGSGDEATHSGELVLRQRAAALARPPAPAEAPGTHLDLLRFRLADEHYAVETRFVVAVHALRQLTPIPCTPPHILGVVNVRGRILPVIDLKKLFELPERGLSDLHRVIEAHIGELRFGLLADLGVEIARAPGAALQRSVATLGGIRADYLMGVATGGLIVLDLERIAADPRILVDEEVAI